MRTDETHRAALDPLPIKAQPEKSEPIFQTAQPVSKVHHHHEPKYI